MIDNILIENYKSIKKMQIDLKKINLLIGANGAGKTNFISFLKFLNAISEEKLQEYVAEASGADNLLYFGSKFSDYLYSELKFNITNYEIKLKPSIEDSFYFEYERVQVTTDNGEDWTGSVVTQGGAKESALNKSKILDPKHVQAYLNDFKIYHFHDTSSTAKVKQFCNVEDNRFLRYDASNLSAFLFLMKERYPENFKRIEETVKLIAPYFRKFKLNPRMGNNEQIRLEWEEVGSDKYFNAHHLSDGTLRIICLITLFLQPNPPGTIIIDEPELGLHPYAIFILSELIKNSDKQVIVSTQSVTLINHFTPEDIIVVDKKDNQSVFVRPDKEALDIWMEDYTLGEIWEKNLIGGRP